MNAEYGEYCLTSLIRPKSLPAIWKHAIETKRVIDGTFEIRYVQEELFQKDSEFCEITLGKKKLFLEILLKPK